MSKLNITNFQGKSPIKITILSSNDDIASITIRTQLLSHYSFKQQATVAPWKDDIIKKLFCLKLSAVEFSLIVIDEEEVHLDKFLKPKEMFGDFIFAISRHQSASGKKALMCHTPGNLNEDNSAGGDPFSVSVGSGVVLYYFYNLLTKFAKERNYNVPVNHEVDHHGPSRFLQPLSYIELGSSETDWEDQKGGKIIADTIIETGKILGNSEKDNPIINYSEIKTCVGFGGGHYMPSFTSLLSNGYAFAHTVPKYKVLTLNKKMIQQLQDRTIESIFAWVIDWKGLNSAQKQHLIPLLEETTIPILKTKQLRNKIKENGNNTN